jgi:pyruvate formate lyase activating enzyme
VSPEVTSQPYPMEAKSPFEFRLDQSRDLQEPAVKKALESGEIGFLHSFTTGSTVDGPGVRVVAWTAACHWRCLYCHNPDTWNRINGMAIPLERAVEVLSQYRFGLKSMSGGFTLSGGEPLIQDRFAVKLFKAAKAMGIHTALDTNGHLGTRLKDDELEEIDLVILDLKTWDPERHLHLTGAEVGPTLDFARRLASCKRTVWLRFVLVPGLTDDYENVAPIARFARELGNIERVDVLPFHQMGQYKWKNLGLSYTLEDVRPPSSDRIEWACGLFRAEGLQAF